MKASEILALFVAKDDPREYLMLPTRANGYLYATNGHICVRCKDDPEVADSADPVAKNIPARVDRLISVTDYEEVVFKPLVFERVQHKCRSCKGTGHIISCYACDDGTFDHYGIEYECRTCDAMGFIPDDDSNTPCHECDGNKYTLNHARVDGRLFNGDYLDRLSKLPDIQIYVSIDESAASIFKFTGGIGVIMPMRG
mgnify:FL=1